MKTAIIMRGLPGNGKSTIAGMLATSSRTEKSVICSADYYHTAPDGSYHWKPENMGKAHEFCRETFKNAVDAGTPLVIVDNTNTKPSEFEFYANYGKANGYWVVEVTVGDASTKSIENSKKYNTHNVPEETIEGMARRFQFGHVSREHDKK